MTDALVVGASAEHSEDYLQRALAIDDGARHFGEIGIGTNFGVPAPPSRTAASEKIGGTVQLALGAYAETGGENESLLVR